MAVWICETRFAVVIWLHLSTQIQGNIYSMSDTIKDRSELKINIYFWIVFEIEISEKMTSTKMMYV